MSASAAQESEPLFPGTSKAAKLMESSRVDLHTDLDLFMLEWKYRNGSEI
ncbi:hypothetical protein TRIP_B330527 [uncultured Desulfatiglans sp.]|nr:hypothetical protein TRIP_B330527 [uncultured Desulfatiglans sp.]